MKLAFILFSDKKFKKEKNTGFDTEANVNDSLKVPYRFGRDKNYAFPSFEIENIRGEMNLFQA